MAFAAVVCRVSYVVLNAIPDHRGRRALSSRCAQSRPDKALISDFEFCRQVLRPDGVILFHHFSIMYPAVERICKSLSAERVTQVQRGG